MAPKKSIVWRYFEKCKTPEFSQCLLCPKKVRSSGNTSNLKCHLRSLHPKEFNILFEVKENSNEKTDLKSIESNPEENVLESHIPSSPRASTSAESAVYSVNDNELSFSSCSSSVSTLSLKHQKQKAYAAQPKINHSFKNVFSWSEGGTQFNKMTTAIVYMICKDFQPISIVEDEGFKHLIVTAVPQYKIPSRKTISTLLDKKYDLMVSVFKEKIQDKTFTITADIWTDMQTRSYLGVTIHFSEEGRIHSGTLGVIELDDKHTSEYIVRQIENVLKEWNIPKENITAAVTDGAANMSKAIDLLFTKNRHIHCFAHQLNLIAERAVKSITALQNIIKSIKEIVTWFKQSVVAADELRKAQVGKVEKKLVQMVPTRWNSTYHMISRFLDLREDINMILNRHPSAPIMITAREIEELKIVMLLLKPLDTATKQLSGQTYATSSIVLPLIYNLENSILSIETNSIDSANSSNTAKTLKINLLSEIENRFGAAEQVHLLTVSTLLDPRFKKIYFKNPLNCAKAVEIINVQLSQNRTQNNQAANQSMDYIAGKPFSNLKLHNYFFIQLKSSLYYMFIKY